MVKDLSIIIGGPQGAGLESSMQMLSTAFARKGYGIVSDREYFSNIKGKHSYINIRVSSLSIPKALKGTVQIVGAMDSETVFTHFDDLEDEGCIIYDTSSEKKLVDTIPSMEPQLKERLKNNFKEIGVDGSISSLINFLKNKKKINAVGLNYPDVLASIKDKFKLAPEQASRYVSSILFGAIAGLVDLDWDGFRYALERRFKGLEKILEQNSYLALYVSNLVKNGYGSLVKIEPSTNVQSELIVGSGIDLVAMGKIIGGLRYQSYYPITPAADESFFLETYDKLEVDGDIKGGIVVIQTEDEIAAVASAIGASLTGTRSATATSGPGFSLMVEGLGYAGINEVPLVITYYQRGGPSTGQPTRGSQADLLFTMFASHGEFPRIIIASGDHEEAFYDSALAFNLAEKYQVPVIHLLDKFLANSIATVPMPNLQAIKIERGVTLENPPKGYKRFDFSKVISPRAPLGSNTLMWYTGDEHDEYGHINEDPVNRMIIYDKRIKKLEIADKEITQEQKVIYYGPEDADFLLVGWGYVKMVALEVLEELKIAGYKGAYMHIKMFSPFPSNYVKSIIKKFTEDKVIAVEHNYHAQASLAIRLFTGMNISRSIVKYTGRPIHLNEVVKAVRKIFDEGVSRVVLSSGA